VIITSKDKSYHYWWEAVIEDAESEIKASQERIAHLRSSIRAFKTRMEAGEPLPEGLKSFRVTAQEKPQREMPNHPSGRGATDLP
jgi:hypothetical protein